MCGRFIVSPREEFYRLAMKGDAGLLAASNMLFDEFASKGREVFPTNSVPVLTPDGAPRVVSWGYSRQGSRSVVFNARSETVRSSPFFRDSVYNGRCAVSAECYFEWEHKNGSKAPGTKYRITTRSTPLIFAAIMRQTPTACEMTILTRDAAEDIAFIHSRMPVMLDMRQLSCWFSPEWQSVLDAYSAPSLSFCAEV